LDEIIVTASAFPESRSRIASTTQVLDEDTIRRSTGQSLTELLVENAVGYLSERSSAQTQINIRGGISDGQGRDYLSDVLVLVNGRRAGSANISKLSMNEVARVEVIRGPASVIYGSGNIGGVVNIIMKDGRSAQGGSAFIGAGSFNLLKGHIEYGGTAGAVDYFVGVSGSSRDDYHSGRGGGTQANTGWNRLGGTLGIGADLGANNRVDVLLRSDGCYDCGYRGSQANTYNRDDRSNHSIELTYKGSDGTGRLEWSVHPYFVVDIDDYDWNSPIIVSNNAPAPGTSRDDNNRRQSVLGNQLRLQGRFWEGGSVLLGWDYEYSRLRSRRFRAGVPGVTLAQVPPLDNNQHERLHAFYGELVQSILDDRITMRGGLRHTLGRTGLDETPNLTGVILQTKPFEITTYAAGLTFKAMDGWLLHAGASSGFRSPSATQLAGNYTAVGGSRTFGNPDLTPETGHQMEIGSTLAGDGWTLDTVLFNNTITNRYTTEPIPGVANASRFINSPADVEVTGAEVQAKIDLLKALRKEAGTLFWQLSGNGNYNFHMKDRGAAATATTDNLLRIYRYQLALTSRIGQTGSNGRAWSFSANAVLLGPAWLDPVVGPEYLLGPQEFNRTYYIRKAPYWVINLSGSIALTKRLDLTASIRNLLNKNESPSLFGLDRAPYLADPRFLNGGAPGSSMEGRNVEVRLAARF